MPDGQITGTFVVQRVGGVNDSVVTVSATLNEQTVTTEVGFTA